MAIECNHKKSISLPKKGPLPRIELRFELNFLATRK
jgi:hypothetical protein